ncbi:MAG: polysaccharide biosynthesis/export family protein [Woeseiaceae bacterium]|nr:polysaccharide biosynthesis/export family protein [Woeseiaceae bacterium]
MTISINSTIKIAQRMLAIGIFLLFPVFAAAQDASTGGRDDNSSYLVQPGDLLEVSVWREEYLEREVAVQPDGMISFPLAGVLQAAGRNVGEIQEAVAARLSQFIPDPVVTVSIKEIRGNRIYVIGQVQRPGQFIMNPTIDIVQALALAGGTTPFAELNDIRVLRRTGVQLRAIEFRYGDVEKGRNLQQNIILQSGDVIIVP